MRLIDRIYEDYLKQSRLDSYKELLNKAKYHGYTMLSIRDYIKWLQDEPDIERCKILINRHDIDTSPKVAAIFFDIEKEIYGSNGTASYYFRNSTIDKKLIYEIESFGYETGYHYEEIASYAKKHSIHCPERVNNEIEQIRAEFLMNLERFRNKTKSKSITVASHGDFVNTVLGISNDYILKDNRVRGDSGIIAEAYDEFVNRYIVTRYADHVLLNNFTCEVEKSIDQKVPIIMILTHPRNWKVDYLANTKDNAFRIYEGLKYRFRG